MEYFRSYGRSFLGHEDGVLFMGEYVVMDVGAQGLRVDEYLNSGRFRVRASDNNSRRVSLGSISVISVYL